MKSPPPAVKSLSSLEGCWTGKGPHGLGAKASYELGSDRTALLETLWIENNPTMYTMYYLDGKTAMAHHFCSYGNQLVMRSVNIDDPKSLAFNLVDSTNMAHPDMNHVFSIKFAFVAEDRFDVEWGLHHGGRDIPQIYRFTRVWTGCKARSVDW